MQAKKSLGQNFLKNKRAIKKMVDLAELKPQDLVLEIGPGKGALTREILKTGAKVIALEKDRDLALFLREEFNSDLLQIIEGDALKLDYQKLGLKNQQFTIISNLPYYITGKFISNILSNDIQPKKIILILQKEIVERITDQKKSSLLSLGVKAYGTPRMIMSLSRKNFSPQPNVDSAVLEISNISKDFFDDGVSEEKFFKFLKSAFANKRKMLTSNIPEIKKPLEILNLNPKVRAEDLQLEDFKRILLNL